MSKSKPWPDESDKTVNFSDLVKPVCMSIRFAYRLIRRNEHRSVPWTGYDIGASEGASELACCSSPDERLQQSQLKYDEESQGRDALEVIVGVAIQLGIEQGQRMERKRRVGKYDFAVVLAKEVLRVVENEGGK